MRSLSLFVLLLAGCSVDAAPPTTTKAEGAAPAAAEAPLRRLTPTQVANVAWDLFGVRSELVAQLPALTVDYGGVPTPTAVSPREARTLLDLARAISASAIRQDTLHASCAEIEPLDGGADAATDAGPAPVSADERTCLTRFTGWLAPRLYGRALRPAEDARAWQLFQTARDGAGVGATYQDAVAVVLESMLLSPSFLYGQEHEAAKTARVGTSVALAPHELAVRLAGFLWQSAPDAELLALADSNGLRTAEDVADAARTMLGTAARPQPRAERGIRAFARQWLGLDRTLATSKNATFYPSFDRALTASMVEETEAFFAEVVFRDDARFETLFTARYSVVDAALARLYRLPPQDGATFHRVKLPKERAGFLTHGSFLAGYSQFSFGSPTLRGHFVRTKLLCDVIPPPPAALGANPPPDDPALTTRQRYRAHAENASCAGCHVKMDPIGVGFEAFDTVGAARTHDGVEPVDATGSVYGLDGRDTVPFDGAPALAAILSTSPQAQDCFVRQMFRFALVRAEDPVGDRQSLDVARGTFARSGHDIRELLVAVAASDAFRTHRVKEGEGLP